MSVLTFQSPQDPYGLQAAGTILGQALMQRGQEQLQNRRQIELEQRQQAYKTAEQQRQSQIVQKSYGPLFKWLERGGQDIGALQSAIQESGGDMSLVAPVVENLFKEQFKSQLQQTRANEILKNLGIASGTPSSGVAPSPLEKTTEIPPTQITPSNISSFNDDQLIQLKASGNPTLEKIADGIYKAKDLEQKQFIADRKYHSAGAKTAAEEAQKIRSSLPSKKLAQALAKEAIQSEEVGRFSLNNLAERTGLRELQTAKGAQLITAGKENLISNLSRVAAKAQNQWIEQRFNSMFPEIGKSLEANETTMTMLEAETLMDEAYLKNYDKIFQEDMDKYGYERKDIAARARQATEKNDIDILNRTSFKLRQIYEREKGFTWMNENSLKKVPQGTPLTIQMAQIMTQKYGGDYKKAIENAQKLGYRIPTKEEFLKWQ